MSKTLQPNLQSRSSLQPVRTSKFDVPLSQLPKKSGLMLLTEIVSVYCLRNINTMRRQRRVFSTQKHAINTVNRCSFKRSKKKQGQLCCDESDKYMNVCRTRRNFAYAYQLLCDFSGQYEDNVGWRAKFVFIRPYFYCPIFYTARCHKTATTAL
jgi:hypothetical protein